MGLIKKEMFGKTLLEYTLAENATLNMDMVAMLERQENKSLAPASFCANCSMIYDISGMRPLSEALAGIVNKKTFLNVLTNLVAAFISVQTWHPDTSGILLDQDYIFQNPASGTIKLIYLPLKENRLSTIFPKFIEQLLLTTRFDLCENCDYIAALLNHIRQEREFSAKAFQAYLETALQETSLPTERTLYDTLLYGLEHRFPVIRCEENRAETINETLHQILLDNPQLCHFEGKWSWTDGVVPVYVLRRVQQEEMKRQTEAVLTMFRGESPLDAAKKVYRWLFQNVVYDRDAPHSQSAYGALVERRAVCKGIAKAFQLLLQELGIPCVLVEGSLDGITKHVWNMYRVDQWVHADVTMAYPQFHSWNRIGDPMGYLAMSTEEILRSHTIWSGYKENKPEKNSKGFFQTLTGNRGRTPHSPLKQLPKWMASKYAGEQEYVASGSVSDVYRLRKLWAVKQIHCGLDSSKLYYAMRECSLLQRAAACSGVVQLRDYDVVFSDNGFTVFTVQAYYPSLDEYCSKMPPSVDQAIGMAVDMCTSLAELRQCGIAHLDIQPGNLLVDQFGRVMLTDFSASLPVEELPDEKQVRGTLAYMAPEVRSACQYSEASEVYAVGIVLYCLLHQGRIPFADMYPIEKAVEARYFGRPVRLSNHFPQNLRNCVEKACAFRAEDRYQTIEQFLDDLKKLLLYTPHMDWSEKKSCESAPKINQSAWQADAYAISVVLSDPCGKSMIADTWGETTALAPPAARKEEVVALSKVQFSAVAPKMATAGEYMLVQLYMYEQAFRSVIDEALQMAEVAMQERKSGFYQVSDQTRVKVVLSSPDVEVLDGEEEQIWTGGYLNFDFAIQLAENCTKKQAMLKFAVYFNDVPATRLMMIMQLQSQATQQPEILRTDVMRAFVSYASEDRPRVAALVHGMMKARPDMDIFFDVTSLRSGEKWEDTLRKEIEKRDTLFLCWSRNALQSPWVDMEWRYALEKKGIDFIEPVPIDPPEVCPPPMELNCKHFNDSLLYIINT